MQSMLKISTFLIFFKLTYKIAQGMLFSFSVLLSPANLNLIFLKKTCTLNAVRVC